MERPRAALCAIPFTVVLAAALAATTAYAAPHWLCSVSHAGTELICIADVDAADTGAAAPPAAPTAFVKGTKFPLDPARVYTVDMWSPPTDPEFVALLARATICYRSPGCQVTLAPGPWLTAVRGRH
jgi:hypothetical protein